MSLVSELYSYLNTNVTALGGRIYPDVSPPNTALPRATFLISSIPDHHLGGVSGLKESKVQIDVWAATSPSREEIADAVESALDMKFKTTLLAEVYMQSCSLDNRASSHEDPQDGTAFGLFRERMDFTIQWMIVEEEE
jgi:hypothetical protein